MKIHFPEILQIPSAVFSPDRVGGVGWGRAMALTSGFVGVSTSSAANPIALARIRAESVGYFKKYTFSEILQIPRQHHDGPASSP